MKPDMILQSDLLDILFENRNKEYGAYVLRKEYSRDLIRSIAIVTALAASLVLLFFISKGKKDFVSAISFPVTNIKDPELKQVELIKTQLKVPPAKTLTSTPPVIVKDNLADNKMPEVKELTNAIISTVTSDGPELQADPIPPVNNGTQSGTTTEIVQPKPIDEPVRNPDVQPEFPGGIEGWKRFLQKNLRAPEDELESGRIKVVINFIVNEDGSLSNLEILNSGGAKFDDEVMRVMRKSPKWIAGSNQGRKVKAYHTQPVIFVYEAEQ